MTVITNDRLSIGSGEIRLNTNKIGNYFPYRNDTECEKYVSKLILNNSYLIKNEDKTYTIESETYKYYLEFNTNGKVILKKFNSDKFNLFIGFVRYDELDHFIRKRCIECDKDIRTNIDVKYLIKCKLKRK